MFCVVNAHCNTAIVLISSAAHNKFMELTIKNYRCFPDSRPVYLSLRPGATALIGTNNSGKSSVLKFFHELRSLFLNLSNPGNWSRALTTGGLAFGTFKSVFDPAEIFCNVNDRDLGIFVSLGVESGGTARPLPIHEVTLRVPRGQTSVGVSVLGPWHFETPVEPSRTMLHGSRLQVQNRGIDADLAAVTRAFHELSRTVYIPAFRNPINIGSNEDYYDIQTGQSFISRWQKIKTGPVKADSQMIIRITETIRRIFGFRTLEINSAADDKSFQVHADGQPYKLQELGSGLAHFLIVLFNVALAKPAYVLIDEPETGLHPSLQVEFLTALESFAEKGIVFSTHNLGLARTAADRVYSVVRQQDGLSSLHPYEATPRLAELAGELSFAGYHELGYDKILLVEGPKDVKVVQQFLRLIGKDGSVVLIPVGGSAFINATADHQLEEMKRLCGDITCLIDSERSAAGEALGRDRQAFVDACERAGIRCHVLERRAIENYLTDAAVKKVKGDKYRALIPYEKLKDVSPAWSKEENWRIAREMGMQDIDGTDFGGFLRSI